MEVGLNDIVEIKERLARIEEAQKHPSPTCSVHTSQIEEVRARVQSLESQQAKQNLISGTLGVIGASIVLTIKYALGKL